MCFVSFLSVPCFQFDVISKDLKHLINHSGVLLIFCFHFIKTICSNEDVHLTLPPHIFSVQVKSLNMLHHGSVGTGSE